MKVDFILSKDYDTPLPYIKMRVYNYLYDKYFCEGLDGDTFPIELLLKELLHFGYWVRFRIYGLEILPLSLYVRQELALYPDSREILLSSIRKYDLDDESIRKFAPVLLSEG